VERVKSFIEALMRVGNLDVNEAKTVVYYCIMTWSDEPRIRAILNFNGDSATGKSGIMKQILDWCCGAKWINALDMSAPTLRDEVADTWTVFVEEADKTQDPKRCENWYQSRFDETSVAKTYKKQKSRSYYPQETHDHFGYTIVHTQNPFERVELERRTLRITIAKDSNKLYCKTEGMDANILTEISDEINWNADIEQTVSNSAWDAWLPLMRVAAHLGDEEFLKYTNEQIDLKIEDDDDTMAYEPRGLVLSEIAPRYVELLENGKSHIALTTLRQALLERGYQFIESQISKLARGLGFTMVKMHNLIFIRVESMDQLRNIVVKAGYNAEEFFGDVDTSRIPKWSLKP